jgi:hypothetical protein
MVMNGIPYGQAKYWVELDPEWDYHSLTGKKKRYFLSVFNQ